MARPRSKHPTNSELAILQVLWRGGPLTVRQVHDAVAAESGVSYTTVLKTMQIMLDKGLLTRDASKRQHVYRANVTEKKTQLQIVREVLNRAFEGSLAKLVLGAIQSKATTAEELQEIQKILKEHAK
ncbi:MAG: BlaI/MecI/CopY family transcriptional regulator [Aureliella sp.]